MFDFDDDIDGNPSTSPSLDDVIGQALTRRKLLKMGGAAASLGFMAGLAGSRAISAATANDTVGDTASAGPLIGFQSVSLPTTASPDVIVAAGYTAAVLFAWGDPVSKGPAWIPDASQTWVEQEQQAGMHHDGIAYFSINDKRGLLAINHEYTDTGLLFTDLQAN